MAGDQLSATLYESLLRTIRTRGAREDFEGKLGLGRSLLLAIVLELVLVLDFLPPSQTVQLPVHLARWSHNGFCLFPPVVGNPETTRRLTGKQFARDCPKTRRMISPPG